MKLKTSKASKRSEIVSVKISKDFPSRDCWVDSHRPYAISNQPDIWLIIAGYRNRNRMVNFKNYEKSQNNFVIAITFLVIIRFSAMLSECYNDANPPIANSSSYYTNQYIF